MSAVRKIREGKRTWLHGWTLWNGRRADSYQQLRAPSRIRLQPFTERSRYAMNAAPSSPDLAKDSNAAVIGITALVACVACGVALDIRRDEVRPCDAARMKCDKCKKAKIRAWHSRSNPKYVELVKKKVARIHGRTLANVEKNSRCCECGRGIPAPTQLSGWSLRKCENCKGKSKSFQRGYKPPCSQKAEYQERQRRAANQWYHANKERAIATRKKYDKEHYYHTEHYAARVLTAHSGLKPQDIPQQLRALKLAHLEAKRAIKQKHENNESDTRNAVRRNRRAASKNNNSGKRECHRECNRENPDHRENGNGVFQADE